MKELSGLDRHYINQLRGFLILRVVLSHLGMAWFFLPYSSYIGIFFPSLFLVSGIVTYYSFMRTPTTTSFVMRRLIRLYVPYVVITGIALFAYYGYTRQIGFSISSVVNWFFMNMETAAEPYHLGQVWFLRALLIITIIAIPFFLLSKISIHILLIPVFFSAALAVSETLIGRGNFFWLRFDYLNNINMYHPLVNIGYYCFGGWLFGSGFYKKTIFSASLLLLCLSVGVLHIISIDNFDFRLSNHSYYQDSYYLFLGYVGIFFIFSCRSMLEMVFSVPVINKILQFFSDNAFVIYLVHSLFIDITEKVFGWEDLGSNLLLIFSKITFVILFTSITAIPLSRLTKNLTKILLSKL